MFRAILTALFVGGLVLFGPFTTEPEIPRWACIYGLAGVSFVFVSCLLFSRIPVGKMDLAALALLAWAALSFAWTTDWRGAIYAMAKCCAMFAIYYGVRTAPERLVRDVVGIGTAISVVIVLALLAVNPWIDGMKMPFGPLVMIIDENFYGGFWLQNFVTEFLLIGSPLALLFMSKGKRWRVFSFALVAVAYASTLAIKGMLEWPVFALFATFLAAKALEFSPKRAVFTVAAAGVAIVGITIAVFGEVASSFAVREELWINTIYLIAQSPIWGHGLASFAGQYDGVMAVHSTLFPNLGQQVYRAGAFAGMAHNEYLQIVAELGIIGLVMAGLFVREAVKCRVGADPWMARAPLIALLAAAVLGLLEFPIQQPATALCIVVSFGLIARGQREFAVLRASSRWLAVPVGAGAIVACFGLAWVGFWSWNASYHMSMFRAWWDQDKLQAAKQNFDAYAAFPLDSFIRRQLPGSVNALVNAAPGRVIIDPNTADALYDVGRSAAPYSVEVRLARLQYLFQSGRWQEPETGVLVDDIKKRYAFRPEVWVADTFYSAFTGQDARMRAAALEAMRLLPGIERHLDAFGRLVAAMKEQK